ncbi:MAG: hypothetical protein IIA06_10735 [Proteobacteria bacterium]|nr:hypothetical protein [Pseudomonadota bacterium]
MNSLRTNSVSASMAKTVLEMADAIERTELEIKEELLSAANNEDFERVKEIVTRWISEPVSDVLAINEKNNRVRSSKSKTRGE